MITPTAGGNKEETVFIAKVQILFNQPIHKPYCKLAIKALLRRKGLVK